MASSLGLVWPVLVKVNNRSIIRLVFQLGVFQGKTLCVLI